MPSGSKTEPREQMHCLVIALTRIMIPHIDLILIGNKYNFKYINIVTREDRGGHIGTERIPVKKKIQS